MNHDDGTMVPIWTLSTTEGASVPSFTADGGLTPERVTELRTALAAFASVPLVTLEAHPLPARRERSTGLMLHATSPLAKELSRLVAEDAQKVPAVAQVAQSGEVLYRMVVPARVAAEFGKGMVQPMVSKAADKGLYGDIVGDLAGGTAKTVVAKATFVPVQAASAGAAGTAVGAAAAGTAIAVAAPLVLMAVAVGASAYADQRRQSAIENITELLEKLQDDALDKERSELDGCRDAIEKATALLLDRGRIGASLGLDSAVHAISTATRSAERRVLKWESALDAVVENRVETSEVEKAFPGVTDDGGEFRAQLELAALALALKRRVVVLQAVEAGQSDETNPFEHFVQSLKDDQQEIDELEARVHRTLLRLSSLQLRSPKRLLDKVMTRNQVENLLDTSYRLRALAPSYIASAHGTDVVIDIEKHSDGTLLVLPSRAS
ncbi:hypothetical protein MWU75_07025 [Ornithinimicrobium sp. F0845]|uniref:hypothetical protein n=1 Tax=Ornithinimicrobium sp. F0845 TaxID=2926412 RepID=UPI001FF14C60|nr:hypothetical protein [Ornithinimicrobium sp. F0845]MCK0111886.1 hypothetical protein [Ornithinimicrobium sp. F0845]